MENYIINWIIARLNEPSTYAGGGLVYDAVAKYVQDPDLKNGVLQLAKAVFGIVAIMRKEGKI